MAGLKAGIIGLGRIGWTLEDDPKRDHPCTHAGALSYMDEVELVAGSSLRPESAEAFRARYGLKKAYTNYLQMIQENALDIVGIATHPQTHAQIVKDIAATGIKGILCEKPLALSLRDADEMIEICHKNGVILMTMHNRRWNGIYRKAKELIDSGALGKVNTAVGVCQSCNPNKKMQSQYEGPLLHDATHLFDIMRFLMGEAQWVISDVERANSQAVVEDNAAALMRFNNGAYATTFVNERTDYMRFELEIQCSKGVLMLQTNTARLQTLADSPYVSGVQALTETAFPQTVPMNAFKEAYGELVASIRQGRNISVSTGEDGRKCLEIVMAIYESKRQGSKRIPLPLSGGESSLVSAVRENAF